MQRRLKINYDCPFKKVKKGDVITIECDGDIPLDSFWRKRMQDAVIDGCVEFEVEQSQQTTKKRS